MLRGMIGLLDELATMWKEAKVACVKVLPGNDVKNQGIPRKTCWECRCPGRISNQHLPNACHKRYHLSDLKRTWEDEWD